MEATVGTIAPDVDETSPGYEGWRVAAASALGILVSFASVLVYTFGIFLKPISETFHWNRESVSAAFGFAAMTAAVCAPITGMLLDRFGPRTVIVPSIVVFGAAFASLSLMTPHLAHYYALFVVFGTVAMATSQVAYSRAISTWFHTRLGAALAFGMCGSALGAMILPPITQRLIDAVGWRRAAIIIGFAIVAIGVPTVLAFVRERPGTRTADGRGVQTGATVGEGLRSYAFWIIVVVLFCISIAQNGSITHLSALLTDRGIHPDRAAIAVSALGGAALVGRLATGWLLDRFFAPWVSFALLALAALGTFLLSSASSLAAGVTAAVLIGFSMGGEADVIPFLVARYFGLRSFSVLYALTWTFYAIAGAIGPVLMGKAFDASGSYTTLLIWIAVSILVVAPLMLVLPRYEMARKPAQH
ncbi:MAG: MFS transporter [Vicinamibacteraceae bacterium]